MKVLMLAGRTSRVWFIALLAGAFLAIVPIGASAASCQSCGASPPNLGSGGNALSGVAPISPCDVWAVGDYNNAGTDRTLAEHWNGTAWKHVASPNKGSPTQFNVFVGASAISARNAWAVGYYDDTKANQTLIERWNGTSWKLVKSRNPGGSSALNDLEAVAAISPSNAWAVGYYSNGTANQTLIEHWNGTSWRHVTSRNPGGGSNDDELWGVTAVSSSNVWAVGRYYNGKARRTLVEHWNGSAWRRVTSPNVGSATTFNEFFGVTATSSRNAWAVGDSANGSAYRTLIE